MEYFDETPSLEDIEQSFTSNNLADDSLVDSKVNENLTDTDSLPEAKSTRKFIDGFDEATSDLESSGRNFVYRDNKNIFKKAFFWVAIGLITIISLFIGKIYYSHNFYNYDDSMILVINQTKVSPQKITIYIKTVCGVNEPTIKITDLLKEEFSPINTDKKNNVITWFWTLEGNRAKKAFNKQAIIKVTKANKCYQQQFTLDKEIRIEFHR